ncbi:CHAT domain-containing protein [Methyloglobulus sp.]|uniref:CHAT domain-containing protein n=1 Tax=Methyloglobulus sp. TaxID=2518622 RepID=UPI0032B73851
MKKVVIFLTITLFVSMNHVVADSNRQLIPASNVETLLSQGSEYQRSGFYLEAQSTYQAALLAAQRQNDKGEQAFAQSALGYIAYLQHHPDQAAPLLQQALIKAKQAKEFDLVAVTEYYSGLTAQSRNHNDQAQMYLQHALNSARQLRNQELAARCHLALAQMAGTLSGFKQHQQLALTSINLMTDPALAGELRLMLSEQWLDHPLLPPLTVANGAQEQRLAILHQQLTLSYSHLPAESHRSLARYFGLLGHVYESQQRYQEALTLTQSALEQLQTINAEDLKVFYNWQAARLYTALQQKDAAIASYRRAISAMQAIRQDIPVTYQNGKSSFLQLFGPLYRGAVSLLSESSKTKGTVSQNPYLAEVLGLMEQLKQTELEDFFKDRCLLTDFQGSLAKTQNIKTAIFYPVMLDDRIELLLSINNRLYQHTLTIEGELLDKQIKSFAGQLRYGQNYQQAAQQFYDGLIRPIEPLLQANAIDTIVYVPDSSLRLLPLAAFHDGQHYFIERYAVVTTPSLALISPATQKVMNKTLLAGLSEPSIEVAAQLSGKLLNKLLGETVNSRGLSGNNSPVGLRSVAAKLRKVGGISSTKSNADNLHEIAQSLALPGVKAEIDSLAAKLPNQVLFNRNYTLQNFDHAAKQADYSSIHIASHGFFGSSSEDSFILTYDKVLGIDHLEALIKDRGQAQSLDLLVLSACQTAEGDDRAPLGLSGVALKAKANNALGALWPINDEATVKLMLRFYDGFINQGLTKAKALQRAQIDLLQSKAMTNPFFWAPFILVGNGL